MKGLVLISIYDAAFGFTVSIDGHIVFKELNELFKKQYLELNSDEYYTWLEELYPNKTIIICEDGRIETVRFDTSRED